MFLHDLNMYFLDLQRASKELDCPQDNLWLYESMSSFDGTAAGSERAAKSWMKKAKPRIKSLLEKLGT